MIKNNCSDELVAIARGPNNIATRCSGLIINGYRYHTKSRDQLRKTQNRGVVVEVDGKPYYGVLNDIIELDYYRMFKIVMFRCDWVDVNTTRGLRKEANGCILVNFSKLIHTGNFLQDDPFVFSSQAKQVFYVKDPKNNDWSQVICTKPRDLYDVGLGSQHEDDDTYTECMPQNVNVGSTDDERTNWARMDVEEQSEN